jgi:hypothetical protein
MRIAMLLLGLLVVVGCGRSDVITAAQRRECGEVIDATRKEMAALGKELKLLEYQVIYSEADLERPQSAIRFDDTPLPDFEVEKAKLKQKAEGFAIQLADARARLTKSQQALDELEAALNADSRAAMETALKRLRAK